MGDDERTRAQDGRLRRGEARGLLGALFDLALPRECGGCEVPGVLWCARCEEELARPPIAVRPRVDPGVPCWAVGTYTGPRRGAVLALKERGRRDLAAPLGVAAARALTALRVLGHIDPPELASLILIPAPTRVRAARARGGDPVARVAAVTASTLTPEPVTVCPLLRMDSRVRDSVGLGAAERTVNLSGRVAFVGSTQPRPGRDRAPGDSTRERTVVLVDDVLTTGATAAESVSVLRRFKIDVACVLVLASV